LTPRGRGELERRRLPASDWLMTLLAGLEDGPRRTTVRVLGVIRDRLRAYEQDLRRAQLGVLGARPPGAR
jgi:hypothetical protein